MIPVSLRLKNFMSYGTAAPALDFEQFQVACLSGRNGQGKSALLDAITWSLWGEARKSSGTQKPDGELLRIGAREMQVEFVFDIEGERYRVVRSYIRSVSGKSNRSNLELHLLEAANGDYRPLTGASMRETQQHIDHVVGLDYDTFINSAFLLQGRSDEFTKKRPSERKDILARILNLGRYDDLMKLAAAREHDARKAVEQAEGDIERLKQALEQEPAWKTGHADVEAAIRDERARLEALRAVEKRLTEQLAALQARAREAAGLRQALDALREQAARHERDAAALRARIAEAEALIARRDDIQRDHERYLALQRERDELDTKNELFRGIEKQLERKEADLKDRRYELERLLDRLELEQKNDRRRRDDCQAQLAEAASVRRQLGQAQAAQQQFEQMNTVAGQREHLDAQIREVEQALLGQREAMSGTIKALEEQILRTRKGLADVEALRAEQSTLAQSVACLDQLQAELETTQHKGQDINEDLHKRSALLAARQEELRKLQEQHERLGDGVEGVCPMCGTELTPAHSEEVRTQFREKIDALRREEAFLLEQVEGRKAEREGLRETFKHLRAQIAERQGVPERLATVQEQLRRADEQGEALRRQEDEVQVLQQTFEAEAFGEAERRQREALVRQREALDFDAEAYERLRTEAAQVSHFEDRLRRLEEVRGLQQQLEQALARRQQEIQAQRTALDDGSALGPIQEQIRRLKEQLAGAGFDPQRFREVKQQLDELGQAGSRMTALVNAQQNHAEWKQRLADVQARAETGRQDLEARTAKLAEVEALLDGQPTLEAEIADKARACREAEAALHDLQVQLGQLREKLEKAGRDREHLARARKALAAAKNERSLYRHLKAAFGKHGIPSLIIEQTLPEIEDRANDLLERLTDGKMHVRVETLKDKKTGGTKETLEIKITDEQGVSRPYETFSGGEAFRVNFALRIALARLLAERSGVRVRTLVIDEGFGTQDQQGVQNLVEAIQIIQNDFDKIVVITHLPELKEVFPVRIEVEKDPVEGSCFEVLGV